jgi:hypothetical protein
VGVPSWEWAVGSSAVQRVGGAIAALSPVGQSGRCRPPCAIGVAEEGKDRAVGFVDSRPVDLAL